MTHCNKGFGSGLAVHGVHSVTHNSPLKVTKRNKLHLQVLHQSHRYARNEKEKFRIKDNVKNPGRTLNNKPYQAVRKK